MASDDNMPGFPEVDYDKNIKTVLGDVFAYLFPKSWEQCGKSHNFQNLSEFVEQFSILREVEVKAIGNDVASEIKLSDDNGFVQLDIQEALRKAIQNRNTRLIRNLLYFRNLDLNKLDEKYEVNIPGITYPRVPLSPLCAAAASGYIDAVELLIRDDRVDVNIECSDRGPALSWAIESQHVNIVKALTNDPRVELHPRTRVSYRLPLLQAIELGNEVIVQILLDCGSSPYPDDALVLATGTRRLDIVKLFLESHRITKVSEKSMSNALSRAIKEEIKETVALLVRVPGISINGRGQIALWEAAKLDKPSIVQLLLDMDGIDVDASHSEDCTPLQIAVKMGHEDIVKILPEVDMNVEQEISSSFPVAGHVANAHLSGILRISVNCRDLYGRTALALAAYKGSDSVIQLLLRRREININCEDKMNDTPLMIAIRAGNHSTVQILLQRRDINANHKNNSSHTPLHIAILRGHIAMVNQLVEVGADPMEKTKSGYTALHVAAEKGDMAIVNRLIELGVDPMEKSKHGLTAFHDAVQHGSIAMVNRLAKLGIDLMTKSNTGRTALHMAVENGDMAIVNRLIELGVDPMAKSNTGLTALHEAVQHGSMAIVNRLIELGVDPMAKSYTGWTALHLAAERGDIKMVNGLVELGVDPTAKSNTGWTALHLAAQNNDIEMVNRLVELGVDPMAKSNNGRTALHEAAEIRNKEIMDRLSGLGVDPWRS
jgi:ankyrin repeat protein